MSAKKEKKPKKPTLKQQIKELQEQHGKYQVELQSLRGVNHENYNLKAKLNTAESSLRSEQQKRMTAESQLSAYEAAAHAWRSAFYAVVLKKEPPAPEGVTPKYGVDTASYASTF